MPQARVTCRKKVKHWCSDYTIKSGDSLSKISKEVYGNAGDWKKIFEANKDKIKDPNMIHPGQKIIIP